MSENVITFKILTIGESGVGKTCILKQFVESKFLKNHLGTIGIDFKTKTITLGDKEVKLKIWDTAGQERFRNITTQYYKGADGIILVYDVTDRNSFDKIGDWIDQIRRNTLVNEICIILLGNKIDVEPRSVSTEMGSTLAAQLSVKYFETSALTGMNISESITALSRDILAKKQIEADAKPKEQFGKNSVLIKEKREISNEKKKKECCNK